MIFGTSSVSECGSVVPGVFWCFLVYNHVGIDNLSLLHSCHSIWSWTSLLEFSKTCSSGSHYTSYSYILCNRQFNLFIFFFKGLLKRSTFQISKWHDLNINEMLFFNSSNYLPHHASKWSVWGCPRSRRVLLWIACFLVLLHLLSHCC